MYDYITLIIGIHVIKHVFLRLNKPLVAFGLSFDPVIKYGEVIKYVSEFRGLRFTIRGQELTIQNSLCKFYHGYNHVNFSFSELLKAKSVLERKLGLNLDSAIVRSFEYGVLITVSKSSLVYNSLGMYKNRKPQEMTYNGTVYGIQYENTTHRLKIYDKSLEAKRNGLKVEYGLIRIEKKVSRQHLNSSPRFKNNQIQTFGDLCRRSTLQLLADDLVDSLIKIELNDVDHYSGELSLKDLRLMGYMQNYPIRSLIKEHHKKSFELDQKRYKEILADRNQNNKDNFILKVIEVIEKIIIN